MVDAVISPELALVDPELRRRALAAPARPTPPPFFRLAPQPLQHPAGVRSPGRSRPSLAVAATAYAAVVFGRMLSAGLTLTGLLLLLVVVTLLLR
jgi:hypothetical protein